jgi:hypothetical protein
MQDSRENRVFLGDLTPLGACEVLERRIYTHYRVRKRLQSQEKTTESGKVIKSHYEVTK